MGPWGEFGGEGPGPSLASSPDSALPSPAGGPRCARVTVAVAACAVRAVGPVVPSGVGWEPPGACGVSALAPVGAARASPALKPSDPSRSLVSFAVSLAGLRQPLRGRAVPGGPPSPPPT